MASPPAAGGLRVLVVDDSAFYRQLLTEAIQRIPQAQVVGAAGDGLGALEKLEQLPVDFVVLDIEMPHLDGLETLTIIRQRWPRAGVVLVSGLDDRAAQLTVEALSRGAFDFIPKGGRGSVTANQAQLTEQLRVVMTHWCTRRSSSGIDQPPRARRPPGEESRPLPVSAAAKATVTSRGVPARVEAVAIAASTGGPPALAAIVSALPANLGVPIFIVQHMPRVFTAALAKSLAARAAFEVCEARDRQLVRPNAAYVARGGQHMVVRRSPSPAGALRIGILPPTDDEHFRPSADVLLRSLAGSYEGRVLAIILTGMGQDGVQGVRALKRRGAYCLTQTEESCVVYGMPRAVVEAALSDEQWAPAEMASRIATLVTGE